MPAPGAQILIPKVATLVAPGRAAILGPTFAEHLRAAKLAGHDAVEVSEIAQLRGADLAVVVNPNNPDGRIVPRTALLELADDLRRRGGVLVVDESFADVAPEGVSLAGDAADNIVVLRSFGKFFGLAGLRLGFALAAPDIANRLDTSLGPWAVAGPAILIGRMALADSAWQSRTREQLAAAAGRLDALLVGSELEILGGTSLFRLTRSADASELFMSARRCRHSGPPVPREFDLAAVGTSSQRSGVAAACYGAVRARRLRAGDPARLMVMKRLLNLFRVTAAKSDLKGF